MNPTPEVAWTAKGLMVRVPKAAPGEWLEASPEPRRWHDDPGDDAVRLHPEPDLVSFALWCTGGAMTGNDVRRELERWKDRP